MHESVREDGSSSVDPSAAPEIAELATGFFDENNEGRMIPWPTGKMNRHFDLSGAHEKRSMAWGSGMRQAAGGTPNRLVMPPARPSLWR
jgi:hypothetical protein